MNGFGFPEYPSPRSIPPQQVGAALVQGNMNPAAAAPTASSAPAPAPDVKVPGTAMRMMGFPNDPNEAITAGARGSVKMGKGTDETKPSTHAQSMVEDAKNFHRARWPKDMGQSGAPANASVMLKMGYTPAEMHLLQASGQVRF